MKLFENGVGRPSNEIKKKRRIFIASVVLTITLLLVIGGVLFGNRDASRLQGATNKILALNCPASADVYQEFKCTTNEVGVKITIGGANSLASGYTSSFITTSSDKTKSIKYTSMLFTNYENLIAQDIANGYYVPVTITASKNGYKTITQKVKVRAGAYYSSSDAIKNKLINYKVDINGAQKTKNFEFTLTEFGSKVKKYAYIVCDKKNDCTRNDAWDYAKKKHGSSAVIKRNVKFNDKATLKLKNLGYNGVIGKTYYIRATAYDSNDKILYFRVDAITPKENGVYSMEIIINKIPEEQKNTASKDSISLTCPSTAIVNKEFECKTNSSGVKITVGGAKSLAKGYTSSFTTSLLDKTKSVKYSDKLFTDYKTSIKKDSKGQYINAKIVAAKKGYKSTTKYVKVYKSTTKVSNTKGTISLSCPASAKINEVFKCTTNQSGVTITLGGANSLASGYSSKFTTTSSDKTKSIKYTSALFTNYKSIIKKDSNGKEYINAQVIAKKSGYTTIKKNVKIYRQNSSSGGVAVKPATPGAAEVIKTTTVKKTNTTVDKNNLAGIWFNYQLSGSGKTKTIKIKPTKYGSKVKNDSYVMCETYSDCINSNAWTNMNNKYKGTQNPVTNRNIARVNKTESVWINTSYKGMANKKYYLRITTYSNDNASNWLYVGVFEFVVDSKGNVRVNNVSNNFR